MCGATSKGNTRTPQTFRNTPSSLPSGLHSSLGSLLGVHAAHQYTTVGSEVSTSLSPSLLQQGHRTYAGIPSLRQQSIPSHSPMPCTQSRAHAAALMYVHTPSHTHSNADNQCFEYLAMPQPAQSTKRQQHDGMYLRNWPWESNKQTHPMQLHSSLRTAKQLINNCTTYSARYVTRQLGNPRCDIQCEVPRTSKRKSLCVAEQQAFRGSRMHSWTRTLQQTAVLPVHQPKSKDNKS